MNTERWGGISNIRPCCGLRFRGDLRWCRFILNICCIKCPNPLTSFSTQPYNPQSIDPALLSSSPYNEFSICAIAGPQVLVPISGTHTSEITGLCLFDAYALYIATCKPKPKRCHKCNRSGGKHCRCCPFYQKDPNRTYRKSSPFKYYHRDLNVQDMKVCSCSIRRLTYYAYSSELSHIMRGIGIATTIVLKGNRSRYLSRYLPHLSRVSLNPKLGIT